MTKRRVYFRADASASIGYGHFVRSLALADMLKDEFDCTFFTQTPTEYQISEMEKVCKYELLPSDDTKFDIFLDLLKGDEIVVLDNYFYTTDYQRKIKDKGCKLVCIDDMHDKHYVADIVINHSVGFKRSDYDLEVYTQFCSGLNWLLLRKEFLLPLYQEIEKKDIFICFGGSDFCNITTKVLKAVTVKDYDCNIHVVLGDANKQKNYLLNQYKVDNIKFYNSLSAGEMVGIMNKCKIAVIPASGLLWESIYVGLPSIFGYYVDNQIDICIKNPTIEESICIGDFRSIQIGELASRIYNLYHKVERITSNRNNRNIKDNYIQLFKNSLTCRKAEDIDCDLYYQWANDPLTRSMAFSKKPILYENHCKWFKNRINDQNTVMYLFYSKSNPIGQVRFDINDDKAIIDISIAPDSRGKRYGTQMLQESLFWLKTEKHHLVLISEVLRENLASQKIFERCNFKKVLETKEYYRYEFYYPL